MGIEILKLNDRPKGISLDVFLAACKIDLTNLIEEMGWIFDVVEDDLGLMKICFFRINSAHYYSIFRHFEFLDQPFYIKTCLLDGEFSQDKFNVLISNTNFEKNFFDWLNDDIRV